MRGDRKAKGNRGEEPREVGEVLRRLMRGRLRRGKKEEAIFEVWEEVVGPARASRLTPLRLRAGVLWVGVESSALLYEVSQFERVGIVEGLKQRIPDLGVEDVRFRLS